MPRARGDHMGDLRPPSLRDLVGTAAAPEVRDPVGTIRRAMEAAERQPPYEPRRHLVPGGRPAGERVRCIECGAEVVVPDDR